MGVSSTADDNTLNDNPADWRISARRVDAEARMSFMRSPPKPEYYRTNAQTERAVVDGFRGPRSPGTRQRRGATHQKSHRRLRRLLPQRGSRAADFRL